MRLISTVRLGLALAACAGLAPAWAATPKAPAKAAPKAAAKPAAKAAPKPAAKPAAGKTPSQAVSNLIAAMQVKDQDRIASAFDWQLLTKEMNKMLAGQQGLDSATYKKLFVEMLTVEPTVSKNLSVGKETMKGADRATVEMKRYFPAGSDNAKTGQTRTINTLSLAKTSKGWKIYRLDSAQRATVAAPMAPRAPQGMVPAAGAEKK
jgi:hypothetical protein